MKHDTGKPYAKKRKRRKLRQASIREFENSPEQVALRKKERIEELQLKQRLGTITESEQRSLTVMLTPAKITTRKVRG